MKKINRNKCIINKLESVKGIYTFKKFPILMCPTESNDQSKDVFEDMEWGASTSGYIQLMKLIDPRMIYNTYHTSGIVGNIWKEHHTNFFNFINSNTYEQVLEIGGSTGNLASNFCKTDRNFSYCIIEPNLLEKKVNDNRINIIKGFFEEFKFDQKFDTIIHSHCFEHVYDPIKFLKKINKQLKDNGSHYISIPNMHYWLKNNYTNVLHFEHTFYVDDLVLEYLLNLTGFKIIDKIINPHSILIHSKKSKNMDNTKNINFGYIKELFENYIQNIQQDVKYINYELAGRKFYMFGGHVFSQFYINQGIDQTQIEFLLDNDTNKQDKRLYGTNCYIKSPSIVKNKINPLIVVRAGSYTEEIKESILKINDSTIFI
jgi:2-polyprenyl-3-methyl-5-hydroxy-6-metoxy-1,4-benzoquinol methylase